MTQDIDGDLLSRVGRRLGDLSDLPEEIRRQLQVSKLDDLEEKIVSTLRNRFEGVANVDELIVGLYRDHQHFADDRRFLANKLYRMCRSGVLESVPKRKGVYKIKE